MYWYYVIETDDFGHVKLHAYTEDVLKAKLANGFLADKCEYNSLAANDSIDACHSSGFRIIRGERIQPIGIPPKLPTWSID